MRERPVIFRAPMVRAILEGRKTQTRRIVKGLGIWSIEDVLMHRVNGSLAMIDMVDPGNNFKMAKWPCYMTEDGLYEPDKCPHGKPKDHLWVREAFSYYEHPELYDCIRYKADSHCQKPDFGRMNEEECGRFEMLCDGCGCADHRWRSPIHMPRWASRITLEITGIRVERLQDISEDDAKAEGMKESIVLPGDRGSFIPDFAMTWQDIHGPESWDVNPWVWVIEFKRVKA